jgi:RpiR family transcriptional regulator, carbohydrate utilization regulator
MAQRSAPATSAAPAPAGQLAARLRSRLAGLGDAEARVAQVVLDSGPELLRRSVSEVAATAGVAPSTVVRACKHLGFDGFQDLKIAVAREHPPAPPGAGTPLDRAVRAGVDALHGLAATVSAADVDTAAARLAAASRILVTGFGLSGAIVLDTAYRLRALRRPVDAPADPVTALLAAGLLPPGAVCLAISHTGATHATVDTARRARDTGADVLAVTSYARSPLTDTSTQVLLAGGQDLVLGLEAVAGRLAHLTVLDAVCLALLAHDPAARTGLTESATATAHHSY